MISVEKGEYIVVGENDVLNMVVVMDMFKVWLEL